MDLDPCPLWDEFPFSTDSELFEWSLSQLITCPLAIYKIHNLLTETDDSRITLDMAILKKKDGLVCMKRVPLPS
jgi:hypothetical protein